MLHSLPTDLFLYSYENEFLDNMIRSGHIRLASSFNLCYRYTDDSILAFFWEFFQGGEIYCYANLFCYANFSIVFGPNFRGTKSTGGKLPQGAPPVPPVEESQDCF